MEKEIKLNFKKKERESLDISGIASGDKMRNRGIF